MKKPSTYISFSGSWLGDVVFSKQTFDQAVLEEFFDEDFDELSNFAIHKKVGIFLLDQVQKSPLQSFLLPSIIHFIETVREELLPSYVFASFELYIENYSGLSFEEIYLLRGKIVGRVIPRSEYQCFFPIGLNKTYKGSHFSIAHFSPDVDTTIASFHGFLDAFAARVGDGCHYWQVPLGPPKASVEIDNLFYSPLGDGVFDILSKKTRDVSVSSLDILSQQNITMKNLQDSSIGSLKGRKRNSVIVTDDNGGFVADWRSVDFDEVMIIIKNFSEIIQTFEKKLYTVAVSFLVNKIDLQAQITELLENTFGDFLQERSHDGESCYRLGELISKVLGFDHSLQTTFSDFFNNTPMLKKVHDELVALDSNCKIEHCLQSVSKSLEEYFFYLETFEVAIAIKRNVLEIQPVTATHLDDFRTIKEKMDSFSHLTVVHEEDSLSTPLGVISRPDLKGAIATASLRDFSNNDEMEKPSYVEIISCIDHHKSDLKTSSPSTMIISDAQSANSMVAALNLKMNQKYGSRGYAKEKLEEMIKEAQSQCSLSSIRITQSLLERKKALLSKKTYYVSREKEFLDYYHFLFAILDDTDLLTKVTPYDVVVVKDLLNNLKSIMLEKEVEIIDFDDLDQDSQDFAAHAAKKLLQTHDLYSLYSESYKKKELNVEAVLKKATSSMEIPFFQDTKVINSFAQVGQCKLFSSNYTTFKKKKAEIKKHWVKRSIEASKENPNLEVFIFMISTIDSSDDLFRGNEQGACSEKDEIWVTSATDDRAAMEKAKRFIYNFLRSPKVHYQNVTIELDGNMQAMEKALDANFSKVVCKLVKNKYSCADIYIERKSVKSRKTDIAPYI